MTHDAGRISRPQYDFIRDLLNKHPERVEVLKLVLGEKSEEQVTTAYALRFITIRKGGLAAIAAGDPTAVEKARAELLLPSIPRLYSLWRGALSHTMTYAEASFFIEWLLASFATQRSWLLHYPSPLAV